jgi:uncharacterized protein
MADSSTTIGRLAGALEAFTVHDALSADDIEFIRAQTTIWISTVDADGWPDVSYKGGDIGSTVSIEPADVERHHGAQAVIIVRAGRVFPNCGRYIHHRGQPALA